MNEALWNKCAEFHGHTCPGLATGFRVAVEAMARLGLDGPETGEELVCVTENDTCAVDAVQVVTGCTMGKGSLLYRGTGKMVFTFYCRRNGRGLRVAVKPGTAAWTAPPGRTGFSPHRRRRCSPSPRPPGPRPSGPASSAT